MAVVKPLCARQAARWPFWKNRRRMPRSFRRGAWRSSAVRGRIGRACSTSWNARGWRIVPRGDEVLSAACFEQHCAPAAPALCLWEARTLTDPFPVAVVGTRRASAYGVNHTRVRWRVELAHGGVCVVSGLALGVDASAHDGRAGCRAGEPLPFWAAHWTSSIRKKIGPLMERHSGKSGGSVVSEYPPGTAPTKYSFLQRNRIIAGMRARYVG